jgi:hypothetical protein
MRMFHEMLAHATAGILVVALLVVVFFLFVRSCSR